MKDEKLKHKLNIAGKWYTTDPDASNGEGCIACNVCFTAAPDLFSEDEDGYAYVSRQPQNNEEELLMEEQQDACPVNSISTEA